MLSIKGEIKPLISILAYCKLPSGGKSVSRSIWGAKFRAVLDLFSGGTNEEEEDKALRIIMKMGSYEDLALMVSLLTWDRLDDELDEKDLTEIAGRLSTLRDRKEHAIDTVLRSLALDPATFKQTPSTSLDQAIRARVNSLGGPGQVTFADSLLERRVALLDAIALFALRGRGLETHTREFIVLVDELANRLPARAPDLNSLSWAARYDDLVCSGLDVGSYRVLLSTLPDMVDPNLPVQRRTALFDTLRRRDTELRAMQDFIMVLGTVQQRTDVERFMDAMRVFLDNFTPTPPTPTLIQTIAGFFDSVASEIVGLRSDVVNAAQGLIDAFTLSHLTGDEKDDKSRQTVGVLGDRVAVLPFRWKAQMITMMAEGFCDDDDEQAILKVLTHSKKRSIAEFAQLISAQGWESLDSSFDGQEYDDLELLLSKF